MIASDTQLSEITTALIHTISPTVLPRSMAATAVRIMRMLAEGHPVALQGIADASDVPIEQAKLVIQKFREMGLAELNANGSVVGMIVSLRPTVHHLRINGVNLFAWCAIDTLLLPEVLGQSAEVESVCAGTEEKVRFTVTADGVQSLNPARTVLSIVAPECTLGISPQCGPDIVGSQGAFCSNVLFFSSPETAAPWLNLHPGAVILPIGEAYGLARKVWSIPFLASLSGCSQTNDVRV